MYRYIFKRLLLMIPTLLGAAVLVFFLLRLLPGDVCEVRLAGSGLYVEQSDIELCREEVGLNDSLPTQFIKFVGGYFTGNMGNSMWTGQPIMHEIGLRFQLTLQLAVMTTIIAVIIALPLGIISAIRQNTWLDYAVRTFSIAGIAIPSFWLGIMVILGILLITKNFFGAGWVPPIEYVSPFEDLFGNLSQLIWPALATGYRYSAVATRMTRSAMLEVLREDYIRTARAKGLYEKVIINRHALQNAMLPVVTVIAIEFAFLMGGLVVTEQVFNLNGLGKLFVDAVGNQDFALTQALVMIVVSVFVFTNLAVDVLYAWLDPRIRYS